MIVLNFKNTKTAIKDIFASWGRSFLTILGILVGISSVIFMVSVGVSSKQAIANSIAGISSNAVYIMPGQKQEKSMSMMSMLFSGFDVATVNKLKKLQQLDYVEYAAGQSVNNVSLVFPKKRVDFPVWFITSGFVKAINHRLVAGRKLADRDFSIGANVVLIGQNAADQILKQGVGNYISVVDSNTANNGVENRNSIINTDQNYLNNKYKELIGRHLNINGHDFVIIGVVIRDSMMSGIGTFNDSIIIPYTSARKYWQIDKFQVFIVKLKDMSYLPALKKVLPEYINGDYYLQTQQDLLQQADLILNILTIFISLIASVSLVVGGIGVMNIMLVTVKEKIREVGLRKAVGATNLDILALFLAQSVIYNLIGAVLGIFLGILESFVVTKFVNLPFTISIKAVVLAVVISFIIGILSGIYPAILASRLSPAEALREE